MSDDLQLDRAEYSQPQATSCAVCQREIRDTYYEVNRKVLCASCHAQVAAALTGGLRSTRFFAALGYGLAAGAAGSLVYYGVRKLFGIELSLISILIGYGVGVGVKKGSGGRGGWFYQALAMFLTYTSIVMSYLPELANAVSQQANGDIHVIGWVLVTPILIGLAYVAPFLGGTSNILGLIIIAIGLWEAWKHNKRTTLIINGPYRLAASAPSVAAEADPVVPPPASPPVAADGG